MSQKQTLEIADLKRRVERLEAVVERLDTGEFEGAPSGPYKARHKHLGKWIIEDGEGRVLDQYGLMKKADAILMAEELNGATAH